ncbi:MAG TPA: 3-hydroxyacyl-CoA dehydrogenase NAD-binding domain-containing protein [Zoogloea sp.]|uniref:3-hydroxyacyl-CoA dehydrogenase NAD-binding domain-containing protein n=3 Tax=Zoogloea sp. TaxID=49181 RepID=UPI002CFEABB9|nr:3-hydroxyacyl-CoA dehydrogenase NAD-binding domain-containing protein [Zoogloea sp.]HMV16750.1 3-hydroxyacyl-CoA dehydrogenase NAD-binding domain-containing protein [Rhodocyclaceae bacterium]HMV63009.1 3-hydroxyacyl-CoA dehydrogenase NAD-binding domain-containing protein [Rhodocyclaceae bacterium]HMW51042.1 3-hydroxyacyl-CoA dehydrogenase NAD-binding domain-containing protein [Rhodocyclaceae bacterium]HMY50213.1 3-hydroxyacyl-CoA dehydrogenase NAD-binding domain-containing protein [Rhodocycl
MDLKHWTLERDADGLAWATLNVADAATNTLGRAVLDELGALLDDLDRQPPTGLAIRSGKPAGFIAGANIEEFTRIDSAEAARTLVNRGWALFNRLAAVTYPTLALIRGHCMGGGLELALACRYRLTVDEPGTRLSLPEVMLGIYPAWGGMLRLPRLIGPAAALDLMLTGKSVDALKAKRLGLADDCVPPRVMDSAARVVLLSGRSPRRLPFGQRLLNGPLKGVVAARARTTVAAKARPEHYPAPYAIIDLWANHGGNALAAPAASPSSLEAIFRSPTAKNLIRVFFLQERLKGFGKDTDFRPQRVHVVGAGVMGGDIAAECALRGMVVTLQDQSAERIAPAIARAAKRFERKFRGKRREARFALDRLIPDPAGHGVARADVIIEAIFENLEAKRTLLADLERRARPDAVLASNTSSLRIGDIATALREPARLVGIHFFNPVAMMPLVEVVRTGHTADAPLRCAAAFVRALDKLPLPVRDEPGFLVNAVLGPYMYEALRCVDEGIAPATVDAALTAFGMPMGPIELVDTVGLDIAVAAGTALAGADAVLPRTLADKVAAGWLGRKSGQGFYLWQNGKAQKSAPGPLPDGLAERIVLPLRQAVQACVDKGVVADADLADAGVIFGTGFAPFTGGPLHDLASRARP